MPRLLYVVHGHPAFSVGGTEIFAKELFEEVRRQAAYEPLLVARVPNARPPNQSPWSTLRRSPSEILFHSDPGSFDYYFQKRTNKAALTKHFKELLISWRPEVIHFHHTTHIGMELLALVRAVLPESAIVYTLHDYASICAAGGEMLRITDGSLCDRASPRRCHECLPTRVPAEFKVRELFTKAHLRLVDRFISPSTFLRERYVDWGLSSDRIEVLDCGRLVSEPVPHRSLAASDARSSFGYFGSLHRSKGILHLLEAMQILQDSPESPAQLRVHGANLETQSQEYQREFGATLTRCESSTTIAGRYTTDQIPELMREVDWVIVPSITWENSPLVIQEAFMHRRPVICSDIGGMAEKVRDNCTGLHFRVADSRDLARVLNNATDPELWRKLSGNIEPVYSIENCARDHARLYDSCRRSRTATTVFDLPSTPNSSPTADGSKE